MPIFTPPPGDDPLPLPTGCTVIISGTVLISSGINPNCNSTGSGQSGISVRLTGRLIRDPSCTIEGVPTYIAGPISSDPNGDYSFTVPYHGEYTVFAATNAIPGHQAVCVSRTVSLTNCGDPGNCQDHPNQNLVYA